VNAEGFRGNRFAALTHWLIALSRSGSGGSGRPFARAFSRARRERFRSESEVLSARWDSTNAAFVPIAQSRFRTIPFTLASGDRSLSPPNVTAPLLGRSARPFLDHFAQAIDREVPTSRDRIEEDARFVETVGLERVQDLPAAFLVRHEPCAFEHLEVLRDGLPRHPRTIGKNGCRHCGRSELDCAIRAGGSELPHPQSVGPHAPNSSTHAATAKGSGAARPALRLAVTSRPAPGPATATIRGTEVSSRG
jgi:hypothetical protein